MSDIITALSWINDAIFVSLVNTILQMTILISVVALFIWIFRIKTPTMRYSLWLFVLFAMITLPLLTPFVSQIDFARFRRQGITSDGPDDRLMMESTHVGELPEIGVSLPFRNAAKATVSGEMDVSLINPVSIVYFIWCAVMLLMLCITVVAYTKLKKLRICSPDVKDSAALEMLSQLKHRIGVRKSVALKVSSEIYTPMSLGIFSTVIIVPNSVMDDGSRDELEMILAHELAHIRRYDYLVNILQNTMRAIFFFHPLFHLVNRSLIKEREHICDDWVIDITRQRKQYAQCIVSLLERVVYRPVTSPATMAMAERKRDIPGRIDMIVDRRRRIATRVSRKALFAVLLIGCLSLPTIGGIELIGLAGILGSSLEDVISFFGEPSETITGGQIDWGRNKISYMDTKRRPGRCYIHYKDIGVRIFSSNYKVCGLYLRKREVADPAINEKLKAITPGETNREQVMEILGKPDQYVWRSKRFSERDLPDGNHIMVYENGIDLWMNGNAVREVRIDSNGDYSYEGKIHLGSSLEDVVAFFGKPSETVTGEPVDFRRNRVLHRDIKGETGNCYIHYRDMGIRMFFWGYRLSAFYLCIPEPIP